MPSKTPLRASLILSLCLVVVAPIFAGEAHLYVAPYLQETSFTGEGQASGGTDFDFEDTLGVDSGQRFTGVEGFAKFLGQRIQFSYITEQIGGSETLSSDFVFDDMTFNTGERISTDMDLQRWELMYGFDIGLTMVNFGFLFGAQVIDVDASVKSDTGMRQQEDFRLPLPVVGFTFGAHPAERFAIHAKLSGMAAHVSGYDATLYDGFAAFDYYFFWKLGLSAGYRVYLLDASDDDAGDMVNIDQSGPFVSLVLHL